MRLPVLLALLSAAWAMPALAQTQPRSRAAEDCRALCNAPSRQLGANPPAVQACLIRCRAGSEFSRNRGLNSGAGRPVRVAAAAAPVGRWGAIYVATPPNSALGASQDQPDRTHAHDHAARTCADHAMGVPCRLLAEARPGECVAAAQSGHNVGLVRTSDPRTFQVAFVEYGRAGNPADAQQAALMACAGRGSCEVVATVCGSR